MVHNRPRQNQNEKGEHKMEILKTNVTDPYKLYVLTNGNDSEKLSTLETGTEFKVIDFCHFEQVMRNTGEVKEMLTFVIEEKNSNGALSQYTTNSQTFIETFLDIIDLFERNENPISDMSMKIERGTSNKGRTFMLCRLVVY